MNNYFQRKLRAMNIGQDDTYDTVTGIPPLSLPSSKGKNLKSYSISGNVDESIIGSCESDVVSPDGYRRLEYIQTDGNSYINTEVIPFNNIGVKVTFYSLSSLSTATSGDDIYGCIFGSRVSSNVSEIQLSTWSGIAPGNAGLFAAGTQARIPAGIYVKTKQTVIFKNLIYTSQISSFDHTFDSFDWNNSGNAYPIFLGALNDAGTAKQGGKGTRIYESIIYNGNDIFRRFIPCVNAENTIGMYETIEGKFYGNAGTGTFTKPPFNLLRTAGRTNQAVSGNSQTKRILQGDKYVFLTANNNVSATTEISLVEGGVSFSRLSGSHGVAFPVKLKPNHSYTAYANVSATTTTATMNIRISFYEADGTWISTWYQGNAVNSGMTLKSFTVPSNADMTVIVCAKNNTESGTAPTITFSNIMLIEGTYTTSNAPAYTPYKQLLTDLNGVGDYDNTANKYKIPVLSAGKNLLNGTVTTNNFNANSAYLPKGTYTFSCNFNNATKWRYDVQVLDKSGNKIPSAMYNIVDVDGRSVAMYTTTANNLRSSGDMTITSFSFSLKQSAYVSVAYSFGDTSTSTTVTNAQIEIGSERTEYEPYVAGTSNNIFINNSLLKTGENADTVNYPQNKTVKAVGKYVFTGNEAIELYDNSKGFRFAVSDMETGNCIDGYCNRFENFKNVTDNDVPRVFFGYNNNYVYFRRFSATATTVEAIKAILADWYSNGKPLTIWYPLEEEVEEAVTLPDIPTVRGNATIMIDTEVQPSSVTAEYAKE